MADQIYDEALARIELRLSKPRHLAIHAILFSAVTTIVTLSNLWSNFRVDDGTYWGVLGWCLVLAGHAFYHYRHSGINNTAREKVIQEELLSLANEYDLAVEELVDLHARLAEEVTQRASPTRATLATIIGYESMWFGWLAFGLLLNTLGAYYVMRMDPYMTALQMAPFVGTTILGFVQLITLFLGRRTASDDDELRNAYLRALYNTKLEKSKRQAGQRLAIDDEGEIVLHKETAEKTKSR